MARNWTTLMVMNFFLLILVIRPNLLLDSLWGKNRSVKRACEAIICPHLQNRAGIKVNFPQNILS